MFNVVRHSVLLIASVIALAYLMLAGATALTKRPWCDEACFANPGVDLITRGTFGWTVRDPTGDGIHVGWYMPRIQTHTYFVMPLDPVLQAVWFRLFGIHVFTMRSLHIVLGLFALWCWGFLVWKLSGSIPPALVAMALIAVDHGMLFAASDGRADMSSAAFGVAALASYVALRGRHLMAAIVIANSFLAAAVFCHPIGGIAGFGLVYIAFRSDRERFTWKHAMAAALPYLTAFSIWGWYISLDPAAFRAHFFSNASVGRFGGLTAPLVGFWREITVRYMERSYLPPTVTGWRRLSIVIPMIFAVAVIMCAFAPQLAKSKGARQFGRLALLYFAVFSVLDGTKSDYYLVHITPLLCCCTALFAYQLWMRGRAQRAVAAVVLLALVGIGAAWQMYAIYRNPYRESYTQVTTFIKKYAQPNMLVMGGGELGFDLGFYGGVVDDNTLGFYSGKRPDFVVVDSRCYREGLEGFKDRAPAVYSHVMRVLHDDCEKVLTAGSCDLYARRGLIPRTQFYPAN